MPTNLLRSNYVPLSFLCLLQLLAACSNPSSTKETAADAGGVAVLVVDPDHPVSPVSKDIYGQFLEHINHSVEDGLYAEQVQGQGFEGKDFAVYWKPVQKNGTVTVVNTPFQKGEKSIRLSPRNGTAGVSQRRLYVQKGVAYDGSLWIKGETGAPAMALRVLDVNNGEIAQAPLSYSGTDWQEIKFAFTPSATDTMATLEITASGSGSVLLDFISVMTSAARANGPFRPDLLASLKALKPTFIRWPGGSFASTYKWQDGIGPAVSRVYHPNIMWGGYADYYGFGTDEFLELCRQLETDPMITLAAPSVKPEDVEYAMNWVHYLLDPATTTWGKMRAANGHPLPYNIPYIQIDNEPMNNKQSAEQYAAIVQVYGSRLRQLAPNSKIVACGQKRSNDLNWSQKVIDIAGANFDILGCHNYEYEPENFQTGIQRISDYLAKLDLFIRHSAHPDIRIAVLECSLIAYERAGPAIYMTCPALLMRNTTDNPEWRAFIYHDHVSWFPGSGYVVEKLFRDHYAPIQLSSTAGTFRDSKDSTKRALFFDDISQMKPEDWTPGTIDAIATKGEDGHITIKAVNYKGGSNTLLVRLQGATVPARATVKTYSLKAGLQDAPSMEHPDAIPVKEGTAPFAKDMSFTLEPYSVLVVDIMPN